MAGGDAFFSKVRNRWTETGADTNGGGVTVTKSAPSTLTWRHVVTQITVSGDVTAIVTVESPASTVLWRKRYSGAFADTVTFVPGTVVGGAGEAILVKISAGTTNTEANISGFTI